jgi:hypothetical protein
MGRPSIIKPAIIAVLSGSNNPMRFTKLKQEVKLQLNRERLDDKQFNVNLQKLVEDGVIEKTLLDGKVAYVLTSGYYEQQLKLSLIKLLSKRKLSQLYDRLEGEELPPFIVFLEPPAFDYATKSPLKEIERSGKHLSFGGGPMKTPGEFRAIPDWSNPSKCIASVMFNDFLGLLSARERSNVIKFVRWVYWLGCRKYIEKSEFFDLQKAIDKNRSFALNCIKKFKDNAHRVKTEKTLLKILDITEELISKNNLAEFLAYLYEKREEHRRLLNNILYYEGPLCGGERIFTSFFEFGSKIASGLSEAGLLHDDVPLNRMPLYERFFLTTSKVWDEFFGEILCEFEWLPENLKENSELRKTKGTQDEALSIVRELKSSLRLLLELPFKRRMVLVYLWGFPESILLSNRSVIRTFDDWRVALKEGRLDHRVWLFKDKTFARLAKAYRAVRRGKEPSDVRIDKEPWSLRDLYLYHPFGKDTSFWEEFIDEIKTRASIERQMYRGGPVPKKIYEAFKKKETDFIEKMLDDEEMTQAKKKRR